MAPLFANDFDSRKGAAYAANWGREGLSVADVASLAAGDLPGAADLAWASFPCQDLSLAGAGAGLDWKTLRRVLGLLGGHGSPQGRRPRAKPHRAGKRRRDPDLQGGADFAAIASALQFLGYRFGALTIDAAHFLPQSRPRVFFVAQREDLPVPRRLIASGPQADHVSSALRRAAAGLPGALRSLGSGGASPGAAAPTSVSSIAWRPDPQRWHDPAKTRALAAAFSPASRRDVALAQDSGVRQVGALFRRTRPDGAGGVKVQAEARFDGLAGCLRTPGGGSSRQFLIEVEGASIRTRLMTPREAARIMGLPDSFGLPARATDALHLVGDGVAPPVVRFLSENLLLPLAQSAEAATLGRARRA